MKEIKTKYDELYEKMLAQSEIHGDVEDLVRACVSIAMDEINKVWDVAVEETVVNTENGNGFILVDEDAILKEKIRLGYNYLQNQ